MTSALTGFDPDRVTEVAGIRMLEGDVTDLNGGGVVIAERVALDRGLTTGDDLPMTFARTGAQDLRIAGVIADRSARALHGALSTIAPVLEAIAHA